MTTKTPPYKLPPHTLKFIDALQEEALEQTLFQLNDMIDSPSHFSEDEYLEIFDLRNASKSWEELAQKLLIDRLKGFDCLSAEETFDSIDAMKHQGNEQNPFRYAFDEHPLIPQATWLAWQLIDWTEVGVKVQQTYAQFQKVYQDHFE